MGRNDATTGSLRRRPVSCHFCRSRKLRCSRQFPCPNCTTRGIKCQLHALQPLAVDNRHNKKDEPIGQEHLSNAELLARVQRLESIVMKTGGQASTDINASARALPVQVTKETQQSRNESVTTDSDWLEREYMSQDLSEAICPDRVVFRTCPINQITKGASYIFPNPTGPLSPGEPIKCIWLPQREEARILLEKYLNEITYVHHVVHSPSLRILIDVLYDDIDQQVDIKPGTVALLLSVLASTTYSWNTRDPTDIFPTVEDADRQCDSWVKAAMDVLEYSRRMTRGELEDVQAMIILSFVVCNLESLSSRYRNLISTAILLARELLLHRIDHPYNHPAMSVPPPDSIQAEIGRRIWWYLVATDWMLSGYVSPQEGVYNINPNHMAVRTPRNVNDEDLIDGVTIAELPLSQPTSMSYFIQRIKLAHICREFTDRVPFISCNDTEEETYNRVLEVDAELIKFVNGLPQFFHLDGASLGDVSIMDWRRAPGIVIQKYIFLSLIHARRCKLHIRYMARSATEPIYSRSRELCLQAARMIITTERLLEIEDIPFVLTRLKSGPLIYCISMAIIVLLMDICFSKDTENSELRKAEVVDACSILEEARGQSILAEKLLDSLMSILPKHQVSLTHLNGSRNGDHDHPATKTGTVSVSAVTETGIDGGDGNQEAQPPDGEEISYFEEIWNSFSGDMDAMDWNGFLSDLDLRFSTQQA